MRMRGLDPPRGFDSCGGKCRDVEGSGFEWRLVPLFALPSPGFADFSAD
jgi:hypothetical protein